MRQFAGIGQPTVVRGKRMPAFPKLDQRAFDLVFLDPPYGKGLGEKALAAADAGYEVVLVEKTNRR